MSSLGEGVRSTSFSRNFRLQAVLRTSSVALTKQSPRSPTAVTATWRSEVTKSAEAS